MSEIALPTSPHFKNLTGLRFGRLFVLSYAGRSGRQSSWLCRCDCGARKVIIGKNIRAGYTRSCGCYSRELAGARKRTHAMSGTKEHRAWTAMLNRCYNLNATRYQLYGGRGIQVCQSWHKFVEFFEDMGYCPPGKTSLDRIDNNGGYRPGNCRWATQSEQCRNRRSNVLIKFEGAVRSVAEWSEITGINSKAIYKRLKRGWTPERAIGKPND